MQIYVTNLIREQDSITIYVLVARHSPNNATLLYARNSNVLENVLIASFLVHSITLLIMAYFVLFGCTVCYSLYCGLIFYFSSFYHEVPVVECVYI
jgi:hypothetical protein